MHLRILAICLGAGFFPSAFVQAADLTVQSGPARANLLELFTSEGCSSCPPAEKWFSSLRQSPRLWKEVVPISFHVNYWDNLGWTDSLATAVFTNRQRNYAASWGSDTVYTPGFVLNGREWRSRDLDSIEASAPEAGILSATLHGNGEVQVTFQPAHQASGSWQAHAALLGFDVRSDVRAGENGGRTLVHDFVVLNLDESKMEGETAVLHLPLEKAKGGALAVWITETGKLEPVQAAGGNL